MSSFPVSSPISLRRTYLIARRDFLGYIKTWGFWLTALGPFLGIIFGILFPLIMSQSEPTRYATILDETGLHARNIEELLITNNTKELENVLRSAARITIPQKDKEAFNKVLEEQGAEAARDMILETSPIMSKVLNLPDTKLVFIKPPASDIGALKPFVMGTQTFTFEGQEQSLTGVLHIFDRDGETKAEYWSTSPGKELVNLANVYFANQASEEYMASAGLSREVVLQIRKDALEVTTFNPAKQSGENGAQAVTIKDRIPYFFAAAMAMVLWFAVFTGAYMLLMSMVEEKINKVLEMLLATTRFSEIFLGKLIGVAALTLASLLPWMILGGIGIFAATQFADGAIADGLAKAMTLEMLIFLPVFFILGYVFYGSIFIALGAMAESMQDASTLMTPMVLLLTACIMVVPIGIANPDSPMLVAAAWFPFSAPFAAVIRLPSDPPLWETLGSMAVLIASSVFVIWGSARMFRYGVLSGGGMASVKAWFSRIVFRRKNG